MEPQDLVFQLCEKDEQIVRTYECTRLRHWFFPATIGYLTITNKRILFHSRGRSVMGKSISISEMPIEDTAGVKSYLEVSINWLFLLLFCAALFVVSMFIYSVLPVVVNWILGIIFIIPYGFTWVMNSKYINDRTRYQTFKYLDERLQGKVQSAELLPILIPTFRILFFVGAALLGWGIAFSSFFQRMAPVNYVLLFLLYFWLYINTLGQQRTFSVTIGSKTTKGAGINIPGAYIFSLLNRDNTAPNTLGAGAAKDAENVVRELGAVLTDIRQLGDLGIQKWKA